VSGDHRERYRYAQSGVRGSGEGAGQELRGIPRAASLRHAGRQF
jgi:hypothetical protein